jgi:hypothetical protein
LEELHKVFVAYRIDPALRGRVIVGRLWPGFDPDSPPVRAFLDRWHGSHSTREGDHGWELLLFEPARYRERWWLHALLFVVTLFSTTVAGSLLAGYTPVGFIALPLWGSWWLPVPVELDLEALVPGLPFGLALVLILALHEAGHYFAAKHHSISVTPPFFIPFPPYVSIIGTLGAFIRLRSPVLNRNQLFDVGVAGPLVSFVASLPLLGWGVLNSQVMAVSNSTPTDFLVPFASERFWLGGSLAMSAMAKLVLGFSGTGHVLVLHPVAFAGWLGLFVTALNLLPISQLDGGHILYAAVGSRQKQFAWLFFLALLPLGYLWAGWWLWAALVFAIGRGRVWHPPVFDADQGLTRRRALVAAAAAVIFIVCFVPMPFRL